MDGASKTVWWNGIGMVPGLSCVVSHVVLPKSSRARMYCPFTRRSLLRDGRGGAVGVDSKHVEL